VLQVTEINLDDEGKEHDFNYDRIEGFMSNQLDEVREQLSKEVGLKLADLRTKFLGSLTAVQRDVLEEFQPHFETLEQRFAEMDTMMHSLSQVSPKFVLTMTVSYTHLFYRPLALCSSSRIPRKDRSGGDEVAIELRTVICDRPVESKRVWQGAKCCYCY
jgi:hypothetical protein